MDKLQWFKFYSSEWLTGKISFQSLEIQGAFIQTVCVCWNKNGRFKKSDIDFRIGDTNLTKLIELGFISQDDDGYFINFLEEQINDFELIRTKRKEAGAKGGKANAKQNKASAKQNEAEERRGEENRVDKIREEYNIYLTLLNEKTHKAYKGSVKSQKSFGVRIEEGYTLEDFKKAVIAATSDKYHVDEKFKYLTPEFFTRADKLDKFRNMYQEPKLKPETPQIW